jgi:hypothetical protein
MKENPLAWHLNDTLHDYRTKKTTRERLHAVNTMASQTYTMLKGMGISEETKKKLMKIFKDLKHLNENYELILDQAPFAFEKKREFDRILHFEIYGKILELINQYNLISPRIAEMYFAPKYLPRREQK